MSSRIGPRALIAPMVARQGVELLLGMFQDAQFGPVVMLGAGGLHVEALADVVYALPPFSAGQAGSPSWPRCASPRCCTASVTAHRSRWTNSAAWQRTSPRWSPNSATARELDLNPVIVHADGCTIVDALIVPGRKPA